MVALQLSVPMRNSLSGTFEDRAEDPGSTRGRGCIQYSLEGEGCSAPACMREMTVMPAPEPPCSLGMLLPDTMIR